MMSRSTKALALMAIGLSASATGSLAQAVPTQFIAKQYSEVQGRIPDPSGWSSAVTYFQQNGCSPATLSAWGSGAFSSQEFLSHGYNPVQQVFLVYRAILNREPDASGLYSYAQQIRSGALSLGQFVQIAYNSGEFANLVPYICSGGSYGFGGVTAGGTFSPSPLPEAAPLGTPDGFQQISASALQNALATTFRGGTYELPQSSFVILNEPLVIPEGTTLRTAGSPGPSDHGKMARLVRGRNFVSGNGQSGDEMVKLCPNTSFAMRFSDPNRSFQCQAAAFGGRIENLWVDGSRGAYSTAGGVIEFQHDDTNVRGWSGSGLSVSSNHLSNSAGWSTAFFWGSHELGALAGPNIPCGASGQVQVVNNLITAYPSKHQYPGDARSFADGITVSCENTAVLSNQIIDTTDVAVVVARACPAVQQSQVRDNQILSAGNSAPAALTLDPLFPSSATGDSCIPGDYDPTHYQPSFIGTTIANNHFWTGPNTHYIIGISVGSAAWFLPNSYTGVGGSVVNNDNYNLQTLSGTGIFVNGINDSTVQGNQGHRAAVNEGCPSGNVVVATNVSSNNVVQYHDSVSLAKGCMGEQQPAPALRWPGP